MYLSLFFSYKYIFSHKKINGLFQKSPFSRRAVYDNGYLLWPFRIV